MHYNLTEVLSGQTSKDLIFPCELESFSNIEGTFPVKEKSDITLKIRHMGDNKLSIQGETKLMIDIPCDRCLEDVPTAFHVQFDREFEVRPETDVDNPDLDYETEFIFGYDLDVDELVYSEILLNWPMKTLCKESCKGICRKCGTNLNHGSCDCDTVILDPRMAAIREIFKTVDEEV